MHTINIAKDFTRYPGGRYPTDGEGNGTDFRDKFLVPVLEEQQRARILLDGVAGYPSSFLDEAFAGLVRVKGFSSDRVLSAFELTTTEPAFRRVSAMIKRYVKDAEAKMGLTESSN